jgi:dTDP-4-amino-4,6-dideoxygalactose transaminase
MKIEVYSPTIRRKEMDAVLTAMVEDKIGPGEQTKLLIQTARERIGFDYCLVLRSPAFALYLALKSLDLGKGDGVLLSALSPLYYAWVIKDLELTPVFCDVLPSAPCIGWETVEKALAVKPEEVTVKCMVLHHTLGYLSEASAVAGFGLPVIEDCSQSYGTVAVRDPDFVPDEASTHTGQVKESPGNLIPCGNAGIFTILGLEERDMLTAGGGALLFSSNRRNTALLRNLGNAETQEDLPPEYGLPGMNAALAAVQFREFAKNLLKRKEIARLYSHSAQRSRHKQFFFEGEYNNYAFPLVLEKGMKDIKAYARRKDIALESAFESTLAGSGMVPPEQCPAAYSLSLRTVLFPIYPRLSMADAGKVAKLILTLP